MLFRLGGETKRGVAFATADVATRIFKGRAAAAGCCTCPPTHNARTKLHTCSMQTKPLAELPEQAQHTLHELEREGECTVFLFWVVSQSWFKKVEQLFVSDYNKTSVGP